MRLEAAEAEAASLRAELGAVRREGGAREAAALREEEARRAAEAEAARLSVELRAAIVRAAAAEEEGAAAAELMEARRAAAEARRRREEEEVRAQGCNRTQPSLQPSIAQGCGPCARGFDPVYPRLPRPHAPGARGARGRGRGHAAARGPREASDGAVRGRVGGALRQHARVRSRNACAGRPRLSLSHYDACRCARTSRRACASSVPAPCSSAGGAPTRKRAPTRRRRPRGAPRPARAPRPRATRRRCHGGTRSDLPHPTQHHCSLGPHSRSHPHATPGGAARAAGRARVRGTGGARRVPAATLRDGGCSPMPRWWRPYCDPACRPMCS